MTRALTLTILILLTAGCKDQQPARKPPPEPKPKVKQVATPRKVPDLPHRQFDSAGAALRTLLRETKPRVLGLGEFHETRSRGTVRSATRRFTETMVPVLGARASDLVVETWITEGKCGKKEKKVAKGVAKATERPEHTEDEIVTMLKRAKGLGVRPHILKAGCKDYEKLLGKDGKVDYVQLLGFIGRSLQAKAEAILAYRAKQARKVKKKATRDIVLIYGGALHNDLYPYEDLKEFAFGEALKKRTDGRYLELDLYVPEYIDGDETLSTERWYPLFKRLASAQKVTLIQRGEASYILVLKKGVTNKKR